MIYTRFENSITIIGQCGKHKLPEFKVPVLLARIQRNEDKAIRHQFIEFLKADGGYVEIIDAYNAGNRTVNILRAYIYLTSLE